jgi:hypothetical protein
MKRYRILIAFLLTGLFLWCGYRVYRAHSNLVTLDVRNMEVRRVISKIEWQTWERILVNKDVGGNVTLNVKDVPLEEVLNIIVLQTSSRWNLLYPIFSTSKSAVTLNKVVRGDIPPAGSGWTNLLKAASWQRGGGFGNALRAQNKLVSAQIVNKDPEFAAFALSRFSQALVIPEDSTTGNVNLKLEQVPLEKAVAMVAKQVRRKWDQIYALQSTKQIVVARKTDDTETDTNQVNVVRPPSRPPPERELEVLMATLSEKDRKKVQTQVAAMEDYGSLTPAQQQQRVQQIMSQSIGGGQGAQGGQGGQSQGTPEQRIDNRLKNGTPDQRIAHDRQVMQNKQRKQKE